MDKRLIWYEKLYDTHADAIFRHIYYRLRDRERAVELMQEVFLKTWQYIMLGKTIEHEKAFLYRTANNLFINEIRTDRNHTSLEEQIETFGDTTVDPTQNTSEEATRHELLDRLKRLKESYRSVLVMRYIDDLSVKEIAEILGEQETNISMRIKRGIEALKQSYAQPPPS